MDEYYDKTDELEADAEFLLDDEQYERRSRAMRRIYSGLHWNELVAAQGDRYEAWRLKPDNAEECAG